MPLHPQLRKQPGHLVSSPKCSKFSVGERQELIITSSLLWSIQNKLLLSCNCESPLWMVAKGRQGWWCNPYLFQVPHLPRRKSRLPGKAYRPFVQEGIMRAVGTDLWLSSQEGRRRMSIGRAERPRALLCSSREQSLPTQGKARKYHPNSPFSPVSSALGRT